MTREEAKKLLQIYREGLDASVDERLAEAVAMAQDDEELQALITAETAFDLAFQSKLEAEIPVPAGLRERILASSASSAADSHQEAPVEDNVIRPSVTWWRQPLNIVAVAGIAAVFVLALVIAPSGPDNASEGTIATTDIGADTDVGALVQLVDHSANVRSLPFRSEQIDQVQAYLVSHEFPSTEMIPQGLRGMPTIGCMPFETADGGRASLICFKDDQVYHFYIAPAKSFKKCNIKDGEKRTMKSGDHSAAVWRDGDNVYMISTKGEEDRLRDLL